jgi:hypothetical protein
MALDFKRRHLQPEVMLMLIRWYVAYVLSYSLPEGQSSALDGDWFTLTNMTISPRFEVFRALRLAFMV